VLDGLAISTATTAEHEAATAFYRSVGYLAPIRATDTVLIARHGGAIVGTVRLCVENDTLVLRGLYVEPELQRRGIGDRLLRVAKHRMSARACWCLPYRHLIPLCRRVGFREVPPITAPAFLTERASRYGDLGSDVVVMHRPGVTHPTDRSSG